MNGSALLLNELEGQLSDCRKRQSKRTEKFQRLLNELDASLGASAEVAHLYVEANVALEGASDQVQAAAAELQAATQCSTPMRAKEAAAEREENTKLYHRALSSYRAVESRVDAARQSVRERLGERAIHTLQPLFKELQHQQARMQEESRDVALLEERALAKKVAYNAAMDELGRLNDAVHALRRQES